MRATRPAPLGLHGVKAILARLGQNTHAIDDRIGTMDGRAHAGIIAQIGQDRLNLSDNAVGAHEKCLVRAAHRDAHAPTFFGHAARDVSADKSRSAENGDELRHD